MSFSDTVNSVLSEKEDQGSSCTVFGVRSVNLGSCERDREFTSDVIEGLYLFDGRKEYGSGVLQYNVFEIRSVLTDSPDPYRRR